MNRLTGPEESDLVAVTASETIGAMNSYGFYAPTCSCHFPFDYPLKMCPVPVNLIEMKIITGQSRSWD
jgi:hypothetical protein